MKLKPTLDRIAIKRHEPEDKSKGGIILPDKSKKASFYGEVTAVGPGAFNPDGTRRPVDIKKGDVVFFREYDLTTVESNIVICDFEDILAVVGE